MKKIKEKKRGGIFLYTLALCLVLLTGCSSIQRQSGGDKMTEPRGNVSSEVGNTSREDNEPAAREFEITGKVITADENTILFLQDGEENGGLADFGTSDVLFYDQEGTELEAKALRPGMRIALSTAADSTSVERYPLGITGVHKVRVLEQQNDVVGLYLDILKAVYGADTALNDKITIAALDLTKEENLSKQEKEALRYLFWSYLTNAQESLPDGGSGHIDVMLSTWEELTEEGLIDKENLDFPEGILITIKAGQIKNDSFRFDVEKWRSGLGAIGYDSCEGTFEDGAGTYRLGVAWIS